METDLDPQVRYALIEHTLQPSRTSRLLATITILALVVAAGVTVIAYRQSKTAGSWDPIGLFTVPQTVLNPDHIVHLTDQGVIVQATKCYDENVNTRGSQVWQSQDARATVISTGQGVATFSKGCHTTTFVNRIPPEVRADVIANGHRQWIITGTQTPVATNGNPPKVGNPRSWYTELFTVVP